MAKRTGVLGKLAGALGVGEKEGPAILLEAAADTAALITALLDGEAAVVVDRLAAVAFPVPEGADPKDHEAKVLAFLDTAATVEMAGQHRPEVLEAITARGIAILEPETHPAPPPEGGAAPAPRHPPAADPQTRPQEPPQVRTDLADEQGHVELIVLRDDGLAGAGGTFVAAGRRGKFPADEAYMHLTAGNARLPTAED